MSNLLPLQCKDLAFARNLVAQMKEGHGRHNSRADLEHQARHRAAVPDRFVGRADWIESDPSKCAVGDVTDYFTLQDYAPGNVPLIEYLPPHTQPRYFEVTYAKFEQLETWTFERVRFNTAGGGVRVLWKRIE